MWCTTGFALRDTGSLLKMEGEKVKKGERENRRKGDAESEE